MKTRIQVVAVEEKSGISKATQKPYSMTVCQCVVMGDKVNVGELVLPRDHPVVVPGMYDADFSVAVGYDKRISGQLVSLTPVDVSVRKVA